MTSKKRLGFGGDEGDAGEAEGDAEDLGLDENGKVGFGGNRMPKRYVAEMFCDRVAASKIYKKEAYTDRSALDYFLTGKGINAMHPYTRKRLAKMLTILAEEGEDEAFKYARKYMKAYRRYLKRKKYKDRLKKKLEKKYAERYQKRCQQVFEKKYKKRLMSDIKKNHKVS